MNLAKRHSPASRRKWRSPALPSLRERGHQPDKTRSDRVIIVSRRSYFPERSRSKRLSTPSRLSLVSALFNTVPSTAPATALKANSVCGRRERVTHRNLQVKSLPHGSRRLFQPEPSRVGPKSRYFFAISLPQQQRGAAVPVQVAAAPLVTVISQPHFGSLQTYTSPCFNDIVGSSYESSNGN